MGLEIVEIIRRSEQGVTKPFICRGNDGVTYIVKGKNVGYRALCCEWVAGQLAETIGLPIPKMAIASVPQQLIQFSLQTHARELGAGLAFASCFIDDAQEFTHANLSTVPQDLQRMVLLFDWWVQNGDRQLTTEGGNPNLLCSSGSGNLWVIDHNLAFDQSFDTGQFLEAHAFRDALSGLDPGVIRAEFEPKFLAGVLQLEEIWGGIPNDWLFIDGDVSCGSYIDRNSIERTLQRFQTEPDAFWQISG